MAVLSRLANGPGEETATEVPQASNRLQCFDKGFRRLQIMAWLVCTSVRVAHGKSRGGRSLGELPSLLGKPVDWPAREGRSTEIDGYVS